MKELTKKDLEEFLIYYHYLHDSTILNINYDVYNQKIEMIIDVFCSSEPIKSGDKYIETNKTKIELIFNKIMTFKNTKIDNWDYINNVYLEVINKDAAEYFCFANDEDYPNVYIVCENISYKEIK